jgi:hypothetical protein
MELKLPLKSLRFLPCSSRQPTLMTILSIEDIPSAIGAFEEGYKKKTHGYLDCY